MYILVLGIIFYCWETSFAVLSLYDNCNHSRLFLSCLMCCEGSQHLYMYPGTTKPLHEFFCLGCMRLFGEWSLLGVRLLCGMPVCGRVVVTALLQGLEQSETILCCVVPSGF